METNQILEKVYYDPKNTGSFASIKKLHEEARKIKNSITYNEVTDWLAGQITYTLHKPARKKWNRNKIVVQSPNEQWQADLTFLNEFSRENYGYKYILTVIDCFSRYAYAVPVKDKTSKSIIEAFESIFAHAIPVKLQTDKGKEFDNKYFKQFMNDKKINFFLTNSPVVKCAIVERFNRTLKNKMFRYFTAKGNRKWVDVLPDLLKSYNSSYHRTIKMAPKDVNVENQNIVYENIYKDYNTEQIKKDKIKTGDTVRIQYKPSAFDRGYYPSWTDETFKVGKHRKDNNNLFHLTDFVDKRRIFYKQELQKIKPNPPFRIEKIIKTRVLNGITQVRVKWIGKSSNFNQWIPLSDVQGVSQE